ncbi:MAG: lytic transglycosylase domain-containing protein [Tissierellia bacterium]|nr:lytic transglycosylase domain-containing protein [Tissierellia bacterium]
MYYITGKGFKRLIIFFLIVLISIFTIYSYFLINYPLSYQIYISKYSKEFNVDPYLIAAIINVESKYDKYAMSSKEARGLMQIAPITGKWASEELNIEDFTLEDLFDPELNIMVGAWYLNILSKEFDNNLQLILAAYNAGSGNVVKWLQNEIYSEDGKTLKEIPFTETQEYVKKVENNIKIYRLLYENEFKDYVSYNENYLIILVNNLKKVLKSFVMYK